MTPEHPAHREGLITARHMDLAECFCIENEIVGAVLKVAKLLADFEQSLTNPQPPKVCDAG